MSKDDLLARVWPDTFVEEGILTVHIAALRKALGDDTRTPAYIETVSRSGYRFIAVVTSESVADGHRPLSVPRPIELYEFVGRGRSHLFSGSNFQLPSAEAAFRAAIDIDPAYAPGHAGLALARCAQAAIRTALYSEAFAEAKASAIQALTQDDRCADAHVVLGIVSFLSDWDWRRAEHSFQDALAINPSHSQALIEYGALLEALGRFDQGLQVKQQALAFDPESPFVLVHIALSHWVQRKYEDTLAWVRRALELDPRNLLAGELVTGVYWRLGDLDGYLAENIRRATVFGLPPEQMARIEHLNAAISRAYASGGAPAWATLMADQIAAAAGPEIDQVHSVSTRLRYPRIHLAILCGAAGRLDDAFRHLEQAFALRDPALVHLAVAPQWDSLRGDARFDDCLRRMAFRAAA